MNAVEFGLKILPLNESLPEELAKLAAEGWQNVPGLCPAASYVMFRTPKPQQPPTSQGFGALQIDDSKITVIKGE